MTPAQLDHQDDRRLNAAITAADIKESFESYLHIVDAFYSEDVEVVLGEGVGLVRGRDNLRERLTEFLVPIHPTFPFCTPPVNLRMLAVINIDAGLNVMQTRRRSTPNG
jgi:hypothetical protein